MKLVICRVLLCGYLGLFFGPCLKLSYIVKVCSVDWLLDMLLCILILLERYQRYL